MLVVQAMTTPPKYEPKTTAGRMFVLARSILAPAKRFEQWARRSDRPRPGSDLGYPPLYRLANGLAPW